MKTVQINATCGIGSTGKICVHIGELLNSCNVENYILYTGQKVDNKFGINYADKKYLKKQAVLSRINGNYGFNSAAATKRLICALEEIKPDVVHLHNLHGHNCNLETLFLYIKKKNIKVLWTFHDCWAFTGYCTHFVMQKCYKWEKVCKGCPQKKKFSWILDRSRYIHEKKKELFSGLDMTIITPSEWLANLVKKSFLKDYHVKVINNGIDLDVFKPTESNFRQEKGISGNTKIILGVAFGWGYSKGLDVFLKLYEMLDKLQYKIVLVGTDDNIDKSLPEGIISVHRTNNQTELANIYSAADVFLNPTREDTFPTVNIEALACGTPVVTFMTGGSPEIIDEKTGVSVACDDISGITKAVRMVCEQKIFDRQDCLERAKMYDMNDKFKEYVDLYNDIISGGGKGF